MININQLTEQLRMLPDAILQRVAQMYKQDPYIFPMVVSEGMVRKKMRMAGQARATAPQPKVNDQAIAALGYTPEEIGIAALPAPNMQSMADGGIAGYDDADFAQRSEPVVRMAGGGVAHFREGGSKDSDAFERAVDFVLSVEGSDYVADDAGKGPTKYGINSKANPDIDVKNLTKDKAKEIYKKRYWDAIGGDALAEKNPALAKAAFDTAVNMGVSRANQLVAASENDPNKLLDLRRAAYQSLVKQDPQRFSPFAKGWEARLDKLKSELPETGALPSAAAAPAQSGTFANFGKGLASLADVALSPAAFALKQVGYAASRPFVSPEQAEKFSSEVAAPFQDPLGKTFGVTQDPAYQQEASRRLANFVGENINKGSSWIAKQLGIPEEDAANMVNTLTMAAPKVPGMVREVPAAGRAVYERLVPEKGKMTPQQIERMTAEKNAAQIEAAKREAMGAGATVEEVTALEKMMADRRQREAPSAAYALQQQAAKAEPGRIGTGVTKTGERVRAADILSRPGEDGAAGAKEYGPSLGYDWAESVPMDTKKDIIKDAKQNATPETKQQAKKEGWSNDDWLALGFGLLANKSPYLSEALGTAGLGVLAARREREKAESETGYRRSLQRKAEAEAGLLEEGTRGRTAALQQAQALFKNWLSTLSPIEQMNITEEQKAAKLQEYLQFAMKSLGLEMPAGAAEAAPKATTGTRLMFNPKTGKIE